MSARDEELEPVRGLSQRFRTFFSGPNFRRCPQRAIFRLSFRRSDGPVVLYSRQFTHFAVTISSMGQLSIAMQPSTPAFASLTSHLRHLKWHGISQYSMPSYGLQTQDLVFYGEGSGEERSSIVPLVIGLHLARHGVSHNSHESVVRLLFL
jgi:hypothetical protein